MDSWSLCVGGGRAESFGDEGEGLGMGQRRCSSRWAWSFEDDDCTLAVRRPNILEDVKLRNNIAAQGAGVWKEENKMAGCPKMKRNTSTDETQCIGEPYSEKKFS
jgi:hypothetical protein